MLLQQLSQSIIHNMEIIKSSRLYSLLVLYDMQTTFFDNVLDGILDKDIHNRLNTEANHIAWLTGSMVQQRFEIANELGIDKKQEAFSLFSDNKGIQKDVTYPSLEIYKKDWKIITPVLRSALVEATEDQLDRTIEMMPGQTMTFYDLLGFFIYREANIIGQIALWRRLLGYPAMKYM